MKTETTGKGPARIAGTVLSWLGKLRTGHRIGPDDYIFVRTRTGAKFTTYVEAPITVKELEAAMGSLLTQTQDKKR